MKTYYNILDTIKNQLLQDNDCNSVTEGSIWEIDLDKQTLAPLSHIQVNNATRQGNTYVFNISVFCMDIVDKNPKATTNKFRGNDNEQDVLNTQLAVGARLVELMERGDLRDDNFALSGEPTFESFTERFENFWAGWTVTFDVQVPNEMTICDNVIPSGDCPDATYTITDLDGNTLYTGAIASGFSNTQAINNSTAVLKNTLGTTISTTEILAEGSEDITAPNALVGLEDTDGNVISGDSYPSGTANTMVAPDGTVENSDLSYTDTVLSNGTLVLPDVTNTDSDGSPVVTPAQTPFVCTPVAPCADATLTLNTGAFLTVASGSTTDVSLVDQDDVDIIPISVIGSIIKVDIPSGGSSQLGMRLLVTGGNDGGRGRSTDFYVLPVVSAVQLLNPFNNKYKFTGITGGYFNGGWKDFEGTATTEALALPDGIVLDWSQFDGDTGLAYYNVPTAPGESFTTGTPIVEALTVGGLSWRVPNIDEQCNVHWKGQQYVDYYYFGKFSSPITYSGLITGTELKIAPTNIYVMDNRDGTTQYVAKTSSASIWCFMPVAEFTLSELGL